MDARTLVRLAMSLEAMSAATHEAEACRIAGEKANKAAAKAKAAKPGKAAAARRASAKRLGLKARLAARHCVAPLA